MAQDIRDLLRQDQKLEKANMPKGHEARFLNRLNEEFPVEHTRSRFTFLNIAASIVLLIGLTFGGYKLFNLNQNSANSASDSVTTTNTETSTVKTLGDVSPELKKVEDYYLASINYELSSIKLTPENKEIFDGYLSQLETLNNEYKLLSKELIESGPTEQSVNALIDNLKFRLSLLNRLKNKLNEFNNSENTFEEVQL